MMAFHHRKLLNASIVDPTIAPSCDQFCTPLRNPNELCPFSCIDLCPLFCKLPPAPPPPVSVLDHSPGKSHRLSLALTASLAVLAAAFFLFTCYTIYRFYSIWRSSRRSRSGRPEDDRGPDGFLDQDRGPAIDHHVWYIRTIGLQPSVISAITIVKYKKGDGLMDGTDCSVCLSEFQEDETLRLLPKCSHAFHIACIDTWLRSHTNCPLCRARIVNNSAVLPSQEQVVHNSGSGPVEETRDESSESNREIGRESENGPPELRIGIEDDTMSLAENGSKEDDSDLGGLDGIQPLRRSVSLDSLSASMVSAAVANDRNRDNQLVEVKESTDGVVAKRVGFNQGLLRLIGSPSIERSIQTGSSSMMRSLSCSGDVLPARQSK